ncbi:MAG TPA: anhydro-N-acetylmuramic acid kinase, partial [bacterium]|nr:anhydro-N-acetylmuramic acid kinase [bacterium]
MAAARRGPFAIGLMSGTSADGITAALVRMETRAKRARPVLERMLSLPFPRELREQILSVAGGARVGAAELSRLDARLGDLFADAAVRVAARHRLPLGQIAVIGSHGQTVFHDPHGRPATTLQIGDPSRIAERTGVTVVADFRRRDL